MTQLKELTRPVITYPEDGSVIPVERAIWQPFQLDPTPAGCSPRLAGKKIVIAGGSSETAARLSRALSQGGAKVYHFHPTRNLEAEAVAFKKLTGPVDGLLDLNVCEAAAPTSPESWQTALRLTVVLLKLYYEEWATATDATRLFYMPVTRLGGAMGFATPYREIVQPFGGIWAGLAKTLPREIPNINIKILDFAAEDFRNIGELVAREIYRWGLFEIGYKGGQRYGLACRSQEARPPVIELTNRDTVLISGGGRGIGYALAEALAQNYGCRVIVTGRQPAPGPAPWLEMDPASFKSYTQQLYKTIPPGKKVGEVRREVEELKRQKELSDNLQALKLKGLPVEYRVCDITSPEQLRRLLAELGSALSGVIHNAGVDTPVRLPSKTPDNFVQTIGTKVTGFMNLFEALKERPLKFFNCVGSLTGRWGGMVGQLDYASGNEGLARLGLWAASQVNYPLKTLSWPTWDRLGMIANFEATLKYMAAVDVEEGLYHWQAELLSQGAGEVCFNGPVGSAVTPAHLYGFPLFSEVPQAEKLYSPLFFTGEILDFQIFNSVKAVSRVEPGLTPAMTDFTVRGRSALPVSLVLEYAVALAEWLAPEGWPKLTLAALEDLEIDLDRLATTGKEAFALVKEARGSWQQGNWVVAVELAVSPGPNPQETNSLARLKVVFSRQEPATPGVDRSQRPGSLNGQPGNSETVDFVDKAPLRWPGHIFKRASFRGRAERVVSGPVQPCFEADLWTLPFLPTLRLPGAALENSWRVSLHFSGKANPTRLKVGRLALFPVDFRSVGYIEGAAGGTEWTYYNETGQKGLTLENLNWQ
jgi:NAD(P)-dependent dehydrogenase (short-subunit alcohol dehydrogenase family)